MARRGRYRKSRRRKGGKTRVSRRYFVSRGGGRM